MYKSMTRATTLTLSCLLWCACGDDGSATPGGRLDASADAGADASADGGMDARVDPRADASADASADAALPSMTSDAEAPDARIPDGCDLRGVWIGRMNTQSLALGQPQYANNWYYFEFDQQGEALRVVRHLDCGIEVRGTVTVVLAPATTAALLTHNLQAGRKGTVKAAAGGHCDLSMERFWSVRGVNESRYAPTDRAAQVPLASLQTSQPLPPSNMPELTEDWDGDGHPGVGWIVSGIISGTRNTAQRDWTRYFTTDKFPINAASDFGDLVIRAEFDGEEVVYLADPGLSQLSQPVASAEHTLTLRFLGRTRDDPRAKALLTADDLTSCANVRQALPSVQGLR